jgi:iron-sulfur cluster repair protein YtfE (RIC family)
MSPALPLLQDEVFLEEHRRIRLRLLRLRRFTSPDSGFPSALSCLVSCLDEVTGLLPELTEHFAREERVLFSEFDPDARGDAFREGEALLAEHQPLVRELRALLESGQRVVEELRAERDASAMAAALKVYLATAVQDLIEHEDKERDLLTSG